MAFEYQIKIYERNRITNIEPLSFNETIKLDESLDSALLVIPRLSRKKPFTRFSRVNVKITKNSQTREVDYLIYAQQVNISQKGKSLLYEHTLGLIEPIKWFEKFQVGTLTFT